MFWHVTCIIIINNKATVIPIHFVVITGVVLCHSRVTKLVKRYAHEVHRGNFRRVKRQLSTQCLNDLTEAYSDRFLNCQVRYSYMYMYRYTCNFGRITY